MDEQVPKSGTCTMYVLYSTFAGSMLSVLSNWDHLWSDIGQDQCSK